MPYEYKVSELADEFGVHRNTIRNWVKSGTLRAEKGPGKRLIIQRENYVALCTKFGRSPKVESDTEDKVPDLPTSINHSVPHLESIALEQGISPLSLPSAGLSACQTCGACSSACLINGVDGLGPQKIVRMAAYGLIDDLVAADWPWKCTLCGACETACPMQIKIVDLMLYLRSKRTSENIPGSISQGITLCLEQGNNLGIQKEDLLEVLENLGKDLAKKHCPGFTVPIDQRGARLLVTMNSKDLFADPFNLQHWWKIFYAAGESWTVTSENWEGVNWGAYTKDEQVMHTIVGRIVDNLERLNCSALLLPECGHAYVATLHGLKTWYPEVLERFTLYSVFDLLGEYLHQGKIKPKNNAVRQLATYHDSCNYSRKSHAYFGTSYDAMARELTKSCCSNYTELEPHGAFAYCCGGGGGSWGGSFAVERVFHGRLKARQLRESKAKLVIVACHNCRDQIGMSLNREFDLGIKVKYIWELMADAIYPLEKNKEVTA